MFRNVEYFERPGKENTARCLEITDKLVDEGYSHIVVASTGGETALLFAERLYGRKASLSVVTHNVGYGGPNQDEFSPDARKRLESMGVRVYTGTILTRGIEAALMKKHQGVYPAYIVAQSLRILGQGIKVAVEIIAEACDGGILPENEDVIAVAGTGRGSDTVVIAQAHPSDRFFDIKIKQILAKPLN